MFTGVGKGSSFPQKGFSPVIFPSLSQPLDKTWMMAIFTYLREGYRHKKCLFCSYYKQKMHFWCLEHSLISKCNLLSFVLFHSEMVTKVIWLLLMEVLEMLWHQKIQTSARQGNILFNQIWMHSELLCKDKFGFFASLSRWLNKFLEENYFTTYLRFFRSLIKLYSCRKYAGNRIQGVQQKVSANKSFIPLVSRKL